MPTLLFYQRFNMSILDRIADKACWAEFLEYKKIGGHLSAFEERKLASFVESEAYLPIAERIMEGEPFPLPTAKKINKKATGKKRTVFVFDEAENYVLKLIAYLLHGYDAIFPRGLYSFRRSVGVKHAISSIVSNKNIGDFYSYKVDIQDYFNSVNPAEITALVRHYLADDPRLATFIEALLLEPCALCEGKATETKKGIMAGMPLSGFLANLYLMEMDEWFAGRNIIYARYSDDIIVFAQTGEEILLCEQTIKGFLSAKGLAVNGTKEVHTAPGEPWEFLGFSFDGGKIDISAVALQKMKDKIRRKARALVRWKNKAGATDERAIRAFIRHFNAKFFDNPKENELTWCRWYFPTLTTAESLHILDEYMLSSIRYIATGKHTKANYSLRYEAIKDMGYRSLVNAYYSFKKTGTL